MAIRAEENSIGAWAFLIGVILAVIIGVSTSSFLSLQIIAKYNPQIYGILVLLGLIVGFFIPVSGKDSQTFLLTGTVLVIVSKFGMEGVITTGTLIGIGIGDSISTIFGALIAMFVPATIVVALKSVFSIAKI